MIQRLSTHYILYIYTPYVYVICASQLKPGFSRALGEGGGGLGWDWEWRFYVNSKFSFIYVFLRQVPKPEGLELEG